MVLNDSMRAERVNQNSRVAAGCINRQLSANMFPISTSEADYIQSLCLQFDVDVISTY